MVTSGTIHSHFQFTHSKFKPQMLRTEFAVKMADVLGRVRGSELTTVLNKEGFATMYDVTPDKFQTIIDNMESKCECRELAHIHALTTSV
jgi:hypothetical protein